MNDPCAMSRGAIALAAAMVAAPVGAQAQDYPSQDIRFICGFPAGSGADVLVRYFGEKVRPLANRTIIVENKVGAAGNIAAVYTAQVEAGRPHRLRPRRQCDRGQHASVQGAADRRRQGPADRRRRQQAAVHGDGPREQPVQDAWPS